MVVEVTLKPLEVAPDVQPVHQRVMNLDRDGHQHAPARFPIFAESYFGYAALPSRVARVRDARERDPRNHGVVYEVVALGARVEAGRLRARALDNRHRALVESVEVFGEVEVEEGEGLVRQQQDRRRTHALVYAPER